jgi:outer membrane protein assembly factor BamB
VSNVLYLLAWRANPGYVTEVYALRTQDGSVIWHYQAAGTAGNLAVANGLVYVPLAHSTLSPLLALDAATGAVRWQARLPGTSNSTPTVVNGLVIFTDSTGWVYALQAATGALVWSYRLATPGEASTLAAANDLIYVGATDGSMVALRAKDGTLRWRVHLADIAFVPVVAQGMLYAVPDEGNYPLYALRASAGAILWHYQSNEYSCEGGISVTVADQALYCTGSDYLMLIDASSGLLIQHYTLATNLISSYPVIVGPEK